MLAGDRLALAAVEERSVVLPRIEAPREIATFHLGDPRSSLLAGVARELWSSTRPASARRLEPPATRAASRLPPESTMPIRRPGIAPASTAATGSAEVGSIRSFVRDQTSASASRSASSETSAMPAQRSRRTDQVRSPIWIVRTPSAIVCGARVEPDPLALGQRAVGVAARPRARRPRPRRGESCRAGQGGAREQPAAADRGDHRVERRGVLEQLERAVPWPEITFQSSNGWTSGQPRSAAIARARSARGSSAVTPSRWISAP